VRGRENIYLIAGDFTMARTVGVKEAYRRLTRLYYSLMATLEEMTDPDARRALREARADAKAGRFHTYEEVFGHRPPREAVRRR